MGYQEALEDKIPMVKDTRGFGCYQPPCVCCGQPVYSWSYIRGRRYICPSCRSREKEQASIHKLLQKECTQNHKKAHKST